MNDELKRNIWGGVNRSSNTLDLQLFGSVSNPYTFTLDGNYSVSASIESTLVDLIYYAQVNIKNYELIAEIPQEHLDYLQSGLVATNMDGMFEGCSNLLSVPKLNIDTSQCSDMAYMFNNCSSLTSLDLSDFDTGNVTDMEAMFYNCRSLTSLDLSNFNTSKVTDMRWMFEECSSLTSLDLSNFNTSKVTNMYEMFNNCVNLNTIEGIIDMRSCTSYEDMFLKCSKLTGVKIKNPPLGFDGAGLSSDQYAIVS